MKTQCLLICFVTSATAIFWPLLESGFGGSKEPSVTKLCLFSVDPSQFQPMCIMCPNTLYPIVLQTCVKGTAIPNNVTFVQADCIVGNCAIKMVRKRRSESGHEADSIQNNAEKEELQFANAGETEIAPGTQPKGQFTPYVVEAHGMNITVTAEEEYFVQLDHKNEEDEEEDEQN